MSRKNSSADNFLIVAMLVTNLDGEVITRDVFALSVTTRMMSSTPSTQFAHQGVENHRRGLVVEVAPNVVDATAVELPSSPHASVVDALEFDLSVPAFDPRSLTKRMSSVQASPLFQDQDGKACSVGWRRRTIGVRTVVGHP